MKLYTEDQYEKYCKYLDGIANEDDLIDNASIYVEMARFTSRLSKKAIEQMDQRVEDEFYERIPTLRRIK